MPTTRVPTTPSSHPLEPDGGGVPAVARVVHVVRANR